ncbi:MAG: AarF/ABC1/UbiB kinase family protein [Pseudomonadota bacterium]
MTNKLDDPVTRAIPRGRAARFGQFGRLAGGVAGGMLAEGARRLADGERPQLRDLILTPGNVARVTERLSHLRGAAMKLGQMVSMDAGDVLPPELSQIMARLRDQAYHMPPAQLQMVLNAEWGEGWRRHFALFNPRPVAAASIGQVHSAQTRDGRDLAIKVQYPGIRESIDADVDNVATLLKVSGLLPAGLDFAPLLEEAKRQLAEEADYLREANQLDGYRKQLAVDAGYLVPALEPQFTTRNVLAMTFVEGRPIESLETAPQATRNAVMTSLFDQVLRELFDLGVMQTDPNFANYRFDPASNRLILLDFGACRAITREIRQRYRQLLQAGLAEDRDTIRHAAVAAGFMSGTAAETHRPAVNRMIDTILVHLGRPGPLDFADRSFVTALQADGATIVADRAAWHLPPAEMLLVQRKISGTALLAARLKAQVDIRAMVEAKLAALD